MKAQRNTIEIIVISTIFSSNINIFNDSLCVKTLYDSQ